MKHVFRTIAPVDIWWPARACWTDNQTTGYVRSECRNVATGLKDQPQALVLQKEKWRIEHRNTQCALTS